MHRNTERKQTKRERKRKTKSMAYTVPRPKLNWRERMYLPAIVAGMAITIKHFKNMILGRTKVVMHIPFSVQVFKSGRHYGQMLDALAIETGVFCLYQVIEAYTFDPFHDYRAPQSGNAGLQLALGARFQLASAFARRSPTGC